MLRYLFSAPEYKTTDRILHGWLEHLSMWVERAEMRRVLDWLAGEGLIEMADIPEERLISVTITRRGADVALGRVVVDGVDRPEPES